MKILKIRFKDAIAFNGDAFFYLPAPRQADKCEIFLEAANRYIRIEIGEGRAKRCVFVPVENVIQMDFDPREYEDDNSKKVRRIKK